MLAHVQLRGRQQLKRLLEDVSCTQLCDCLHCARNFKARFEGNRKKPRIARYKSHSQRPREMTDAHSLRKCRIRNDLTYHPPIKHLATSHLLILKADALVFIASHFNPGSRPSCTAEHHRRVLRPGFVISRALGFLQPR